MRKLLVTLSLLFSVSGLTQTFDLHVADLVASVDLDSLTRYVRELSGEDSTIVNGEKILIRNRHGDHADNQLAADYISEKLQSWGLNPMDVEYRTGKRNIYALQTGSEFPDQEFILCAHFDAVTEYCADDNASGVAACLEAARLLSLESTSSTIIYAFLNEEEVGYFGSSWFADQAITENRNIRAVINVDMIGWDGDNDGKCEIHTRDISDSPQLAALIQSLNDVYQIGLDPNVINPGADDSDHGRFWDRGFTAVALSEVYYGDDFNPFYHSAEDRIHHFNMDYFHMISQLTIASISHFAFGDDPLTHVKKDFRPTGFTVLPNYPNPFNPVTSFSFHLPNSGTYSVTIANSRGEIVYVSENRFASSGWQKLKWNGADNSGKPLASGIYFNTIQFNEHRVTQRMILMR